MNDEGNKEEQPFNKRKHWKSLRLLSSYNYILKLKRKNDLNMTATSNNKVNLHTFRKSNWLKQTQ